MLELLDFHSWIFLNVWVFDCVKWADISFQSPLVKKVGQEDFSYLYVVY